MLSVRRCSVGLEGEGETALPLWSGGADAWDEILMMARK